MVRETSLGTSDLIYPLFVTHGRDVRLPIRSMPGQYQLSPDQLKFEAAQLRELKIPAVMVFGLPKTKDKFGTEAYSPDGITQIAIQSLKESDPDLMVITDVCLCEYTTHGHCGVIGENEKLLNDPSVELIAATALAQAEAGADIVAPSDMMDGRVGAIRQSLDAAGLEEIAILAYAAKYASAYYGPFREAADSAPAFGDRRTYQMDPGNVREAIREITLDIAEGADLIMVKPALSYLDVISRVREKFDHPIGAYNVSGEYAMVKAAAANGWIDEEQLIPETLLSIKRAGADFILSYHAKEMAQWMQKANDQNT
jgi:porphobilinogen synthase